MKTGGHIPVAYELYTLKFSTLNITKLQTELCVCIACMSKDYIVI